jgi:hypothetical protein
MIFRNNTDRLSPCGDASTLSQRVPGFFSGDYLFYGYVESGGQKSKEFRQIFTVGPDDPIEGYRIIIASVITVAAVLMILCYQQHREDLAS